MDAGSLAIALLGLVQDAGWGWNMYGWEIFIFNISRLLRAFSIFVTIIITRDFLFIIIMPSVLRLACFFVYRETNMGWNLSRLNWEGPD